MKLISTGLISIITVFSLKAQVGIGTSSPRGALDINKPDGTYPYGLVLPANDGTSKISNPNTGSIAPGTLFYDTTDDCIKVYLQHQTGGSSTAGWSKCLQTGTNGGGGFSNYDGIGLPCTAFAPTTNSASLPTDFIRQHLTTSLATYDSKTDGDPVMITETEYDNIRNTLGVKTLGMDVLPTNNTIAYGTYAFQTEHSFSEINPYVNITTTTKNINLFAFAYTGSPGSLAFNLYSKNGNIINFSWTSSVIDFTGNGKHYMVFKNSIARVKVERNKPVLLGYYAATTGAKVHQLSGGTTNHIWSKDGTQPNCDVTFAESIRAHAYEYLTMSALYVVD